jgi:two-component system sensor histidine kinase KdpD
VKVHVPSELEVEADPLALERVVSNLVGNALRYGSPPIVVSAQQEDRHVRVVVEDAGPGLPEEVQERLFEQFVRGPNSSGSQGTGLGLAIARSYAHAHGGDLIYSPAQHGARFELILPAS